MSLKRSAAGKREDEERTAENQVRTETGGKIGSGEKSLGGRGRDEGGNRNWSAPVPHLFS